MLSTQVSQAVVKFVHHAQAQGLSSSLERIPAKLYWHATNAGRVVIPVEGKPCSPALDHLEFVNVMLSVRVPGNTGIFQCWADECVTGEVLSEVELILRFLLRKARVLFALLVMLSI